MTVREAKTPAPESTLRAAALSTLSPRDKQAWYRRVAQWGIEAADALDHAHSLGIVHRDIKPGNLLIDSAGKLWVTDFGLARLPTDAGLTMTGDLLGTLRYMSPEQALARHGLVDHRTDIYSLGATLYELLTGQPAVEGKDRQEILKSLEDREPVPLRKIAPQIPADLETVVLKALAHEPHDRYRTASELSEDLRRAAYGEPIKARRASIAKRGWQWIKRNARAVAVGTVILGVLAGVGFASGIQQYSSYKTTAALVGEAHKESFRFQDEHKWSDALDAARRALALADAGPLWSNLHLPAKQRVDDLEAVLRRDEIRIQVAMRWEEEGFREYVSELYATEFQKLGVADIDSMPLDAAADLLRGRTVVSQLAVALDSWASQLQSQVAKRDRCLDLAKLIDGHAIRNRIRDAVRQPEPTHSQLLIAITREASALDLPPITLSLVAEYLLNAGNIDGSLALLRSAQFKYPNDSWSNHHLGAIMAAENRSPDEAASFLRVSYSQRSDSPVLMVILADALYKCGQIDESRRLDQRALQLSPNSFVHKYVGIHEYYRADMDRAEQHFIKALSLAPNDWHLHLCLGNVFLAKKDFNRAVSQFQTSLRLKPGDLHVQSRLSEALYGLKDSRGTLASVEEELRLGSKDWLTRYNGACAATLVQDESNTLDEKQLLRNKAAAWLEDAMQGLIAATPDSDFEQVKWRLKQLRHWQTDADLVSIREKLDGLPSAERERFELFWTKVTALRAID